MELYGFTDEQPQVYTIPLRKDGMFSGVSTELIKLPSSCLADQVALVKWLDAQGLTPDKCIADLQYDADSRPTSAEEDSQLIASLLKEQASAQSRLDPRALAVLQYRLEHKRGRDRVLEAMTALR